MKITKLEYQKKDPNRVSVYVDGKFAAGLDVNDLVKLGLYKDQEISTAELNKIVGESEFGKLFNSALNFLSYRPRSEWEIRHKLKFKTKDQQLIDNVIDKLKKINQINDLDFAKWYVDQRNTFKPKGRRAVDMELRRLGVKVKVENTLSESTLAKKALAKYHGNKDKLKIQRFLASRGFDWDVIEQTVEKTLEKGYTTLNLQRS